MAKKKSNGQAGANKTPLEASESMKERAKSIFKSHPKAEELFFTSDGQAFFEPQYARMHGESLENTEFATINRKDI